MDTSYLYRVRDCRTEVAVGIKFDPGEDDFEDVTFLVSNEEDEQKAIERVWKFIGMLVEEYGASPLVTDACDDEAGEQEKEAKAS